MTRTATPSTFRSMPYWERMWIVQGCGVTIPDGFVYTPIPNHLTPPPIARVEPRKGDYEPPAAPAFDPQHSGTVGSTRKPDDCEACAECQPCEARARFRTIRPGMFEHKREAGALFACVGVAALFWWAVVLGVRSLLK